MRVLITRPLPPAAAETLRRAGHEAITLEGDEPAPRAEVLAQLPGCAGVITLLTDRVNDEFLDAAGPGLRVVANFAVGFDNIDLAACRRRGVLASNTPDVLTNATADLAWALILAAARRVAEGDRLVRGGAWRGWAPLQLLGLELCGATLGIVGAGRIGSAVARRAAGFEMRILYHDPRRNEALERQTGAQPAALAELLRRSDVATLHAPMSAANRHLIGAEQLALMQPTAILVNTARGPLVDEAALLAALRERRIAAAGLDVYEFEPRITAGLADLENVVLLPHLGSATVAARDRMAALAAENVVAALAGREPPSRIA